VYPEDLKYTAEHEWARTSGDVVRVGITHFAQEALGDIVYVSLPEVGAELVANKVFGEVESTKSVSDLYAPVTGTVVARNDQLDSRPELINGDPYGEGWIVDVRIIDATELDTLMDADAYRNSIDQA
jgi:glycine cleavage system H protein